MIPDAAQPAAGERFPPIRVALAQSGFTGDLSTQRGRAAAARFMDSLVRRRFPIGTPEREFFEATFVPRLSTGAVAAIPLPAVPPSLAELSPFQASGPPPPAGPADVDQHLPTEPTMPDASRWWAEDTAAWASATDWVTKETRADYLCHLRAIPRWLVRLGYEAPTNAHDFTPEMVMAISWDRNRSGSSRQKALVVLRQYLGWKTVPLAMNRRLWREAMDIDTTPDPSRLRRVPPAEIVKLTRSATTNERWAIIVGLALWNGLRKSEILNLRVGDVDFAARRVHVRFGKGKKPRHPKLSTIAERLLGPLRCLEDPWEPVYPYGRVCFALDLWRACDDAGIPRYAPHDLRRTCVKMAKAGGANPLGRQLLLGHARAEQTRHYEGEDDLEMESAVDALSDYGERILEDR